MPSRCRSTKRCPTASAGNGNGTSQRAGTTSSKRLWRTSTPPVKYPATYHYTIDGKERQYTAYFKHPSTPPLYLYLYYVDDPDKLFSCEEYHYENHKGLLLLPVIFLPWILAGIALVLLGVDLSGF